MLPPNMSRSILAALSSLLLGPKSVTAFPLHPLDYASHGAPVTALNHVPHGPATSLDHDVAPFNGASHGPVPSAKDTSLSPATSLTPRDLTAPMACNTTCIAQVLYRTALASAAVGVALTMTEHDSVDWCTGPENIGWCPPTIRTTIDTIAADITTLYARDKTKVEGGCDANCLAASMDAVGRRAAAVSMLWAKQKVNGGKVFENEGEERKMDRVDQSIWMLTLNQSEPIDVTTGEKDLWAFGEKDNEEASRKRDETATLEVPQSAADIYAVGAQPLEPRGTVTNGIRYLLSMPHVLFKVLSRPGVAQEEAIARDPWLKDPAYRVFLDVILPQTTYIEQVGPSVGHGQASWLRYMWWKWFRAPPTTVVEHYLDFVKASGLDFAEQGAPFEFVHDIYDAKVSDNIWEWVEDSDPNVQMDAWEGRATSLDSGGELPEEVSRGFQMQFKGREHQEPVRDSWGNPKIRMAEPLELVDEEMYNMNGWGLRLVSAEEVLASGAAIPADTPAGQTDYVVVDRDMKPLLQADDFNAVSLRVSHDTWESTVEYAKTPRNAHPRAFKITQEPPVDPDYPRVAPPGVEEPAWHTYTADEVAAQAAAEQAEKDANPGFWRKMWNTAKAELGGADNVVTEDGEPIGAGAVGPEVAEGEEVAGEEGEVTTEAGIMRTLVEIMGSL